jgi:hypothetical protein
MTAIGNKAVGHGLGKPTLAVRSDGAEQPGGVP